MDNYSAKELDKFAQLAQQWWDAQGQLKSLHDINPLRTQWIAKQTMLSGKSIIDIGCGGGILCESLARLEANVSGLDLSQDLINCAKNHAQDNDLSISYYCESVEEFAKQHRESFDLVTCMEMLEHVPDPASIINSCAKLLKPRGTLILSTLNRHPKAYLFAIIGAEYILRLLPKGTHDYQQFIRPSEISSWAEAAGLAVKSIAGISYYPLQKRYVISNDINVNYLMCLEKL